MTEHDRSPVPPARIRAAFVEARRLEPPADLLDAVMRDVAVTPQRRHAMQPLSGYGLAAAGLAAAVVLLAVIGRFWLPSGLLPTASSPTEEPVASVTPSRTPRPAPTPLPIPPARAVPTIEIRAPGAIAMQVVADEDLIWMVGDDNRIYGIDPTTNEIVRSWDVPSHVPIGDVGFGSMWLSNTNEDVVYRIDLETGELLATIPVGDRPEGVEAGEGAVWVANLHSGNVSRIDPTTNEVVAEIEVGRTGSSGPKQVAIGDGDIWVSVPNRSAVVQVDAATNEVLATLPSEWRSYPCGDLLVQETTVWASSCAENQALARFDRATGRASTLLLGGYVGSLFELGDLIGFMQIDPVAVRDTIVILDPETNEVVDHRDIGPGGHWSAVVAFDSLWVADEVGGPVVRIALSDLQP